jgi:protein TonB
MFYRPNAKWQVWAAFCGAILIHVGAVAVAERSATTVPGMRDEPPGIEIIPAIDEPELVEPIEPPPDLAVPPPPVADSDFVEDKQPLSVRRPADRPAQRLLRTAPRAMRTTIGSARVLAISAPQPEYPYEARRQRATGSGVALLTIDPATGSVTDVRMLRSTGNAMLDNATISGLRRWRFKPGTVSSVQSPITYTLTGASF